jgi:transposase InsO family protein
MNPNVCPIPKRGPTAQRARREAERDARCKAVDYGQWARQQGVSRREAAARIRLAPATLGVWDRRWRQDRLETHCLGRPCRRSPVGVRNRTIAVMREVGPSVSEAAVQAAFPELARREAADLHARFRRLWRLVHKKLLQVLHWHHPRTVWAMDHGEPPRAIGGRWPHIFALRDLASGNQLAWLPVLDEGAEGTMAILESLFAEHGPPLVLKSDNGSGFISAAMRGFLERWEVLPLFSPPRTPEYNGACEAGIGALKTWTHEEASWRGRAGHWTPDDLEAARRMSNEFNHPKGPNRQTSHESFRSAPRPASDARAAFGRTVLVARQQERAQQGHPPNTDLDHVVQAQIDRVAISRALVEHGYLSFTRRSITPQVKSQNALRIS